MFTLRRTLATLVGTLSALVTLTAVGSMPMPSGNR